MITKSNYFKEAGSIDYNKLPEALKEGYDTIKFGSKDYTTWKFLEDDKEFLDIYFEKLNKFLGKCSKGKPKSTPKPKRKPAAIKTTKTPAKKEPYKGLRVEIRPASGRSKKFVVWDLKTSQVFLRLS